MRTLLKSLLASASFLALAPLPASALPDQCDVVCKCTSSCATRCAIGGSVYTCGTLLTCIGQCRIPSPQQASVDATTGKVEASDDAAPVCEEPQAAESAPSAES